MIRHGLRNGSIPVVTFFTLWFASLLGGAVVIEVIFAIPGMGRLFYEAVINKDLPVLQGPSSRSSASRSRSTRSATSSATFSTPR